MVHISFTSGELMDIISSLEHNVAMAEYSEDPYLAGYYGKIVQQFQMILEEVQKKQPENRVANLIMAA